MTYLLVILLGLSHSSARATEMLYPERSTAPIIVLWPAAGMTLSADASYILGSVSDPRALFQINGQTVVPYTNGAFLSFLPVAPGTFTFTCTLALKQGTTIYSRSIYVSPPIKPLPHLPLQIDPDSLSPKTDQELRPGDWLIARMRASPGYSARFKLPGHPWQPMRETGGGIYEGAVLIAAEDKTTSSAIEFTLGSGWTGATAKSLGKVAVSIGTPAVAVVKAPGVANLKAGPNEGFLMFPPSGTRLLTAGRNGDDIKVTLTQNLSGWIKIKDLDFLPPGAIPPRAVTGTIRTTASQNASILKIALSEKIPFQVEESDDLRTVTIRLFYTVGHTNRIIYDTMDSFVDEVRWRQEASDIVVVTAHLRAGHTLWGWQTAYENGSLRIELRRPPSIAPAPASALQGRTIFLDPGHMPSAPGAIGPMGTMEMDANYAIAQAVATLLSQEGATPILSRRSSEDEVSLPDRPRLALEHKADLFVSLHNNSISDDENPFSQPRGFSVFYYHPHSLTLARDMYHSYENNISLPGESLHYGDLLVARLSAMPAILIESCYMVIPEHEAKLNDPSFRRQLARAVVAGLRTYLESFRKPATVATIMPTPMPSLPPLKKVKIKAKPKIKQKKKGGRHAAPRSGA